MVTRTSQFTGKTNTLDIPLTQKELDEGLARSWSHNPGVGTEHMQVIFPQLSADHREFLMTGATPQEWTEMFPPEEPEEPSAPAWKFKVGDIVIPRATGVIGKVISVGEDFEFPYEVEFERQTGNVTEIFRGDSLDIANA